MSTPEQNLDVLLAEAAGIDAVVRETPTTVEAILAVIKRNPVVVLTLVVPTLTLLASLGVGLPPAAIAAVQLYVSTIAALIARAKVTPVDKV